MNVIFILNDTFRQDHLGCYGNSWIKTPNLDRLAASSALFERAYIASHATLPARIDYYTGRYTFLSRGWSPLLPEDVILPEIISKHGYTSMFIFDTVPLGQDDGNFMRGFSGWEMIRGHHEDRWRTDPTITLRWPCSPHKLKNLERTVQYMRNKVDWRSERDYVTARTFSAAMDWLERNRTLDGFLLWIDTLDPHEPFDPPPHYLKLYADPAYTGEQVTYPQYGRSSYMSDAELKHVRALYAGEVTMVDHWIGQLLEKVEQLGLLSETLIIHTSDHGHLFGEHGLQGKPAGVLGNLYEVTTRIPLMIRHPRGLGAGRRIPALVQPPDLLPTILDFLNVPIPSEVQGQSLWPLIAGQADKLHNNAFSGRFPEILGGSVGWTSEAVPASRKRVGPGTAVEAVTVSNSNYSLICSPQGRASELYSLGNDPGQTQNIIAECSEPAAKMHEALLEFMQRFGAPREQADLYAPVPTGTIPSTAKIRWLDDSESMHVFQDSQGRSIAFMDEAEVRRVTASNGDLKLGQKSFGPLRAEDPQALVYLEGQYYWAEDLAPRR